MGKLAERLKELRGEEEEPSKYDIAQNELIQLIGDLQNNINSALSGISSSVSEINLDVDLSGVYQGITNIDKLISEIKPVDLSGVEKSIKSIKPTDLTQLANKLDDLLTYVQMIKIPETDLTPIVSELNRPKTVEFRVVSDNFGFPVKVIAEEYGPTTH